MKHIDVPQNSEEWYRARLGKPTASEFKKILTTSNGLSKSRFDYMYRLIYERIYRTRSNYIQPSYWMQRGAHLEERAAQACSIIMGKPLRRVGLVTTDDGKIACSPDRIVDWTHAVEIKCPAPWQHIQYTVMGPMDDYYQQIHGLMYVGEFERISFFSFCPGMPCVVHEIKRDEKIMKVFRAILPLFAQEVDAHEKSARELGAYGDWWDTTTEQATAWAPEAS